jgi:hypothetical protein
MNSFTLTLRDALANLNTEQIVHKIKTVEIAGMELKPGIYGRAKSYAKAFIILTPEGNAFYRNKNGGTSKALTEKAFLTHWNSGMSTFIEEI